MLAGFLHISTGQARRHQHAVTGAMQATGCNPLRDVTEVGSISLKVSGSTSSEASQYSERPALSMAAVSSILQLAQKVCASELFSLHARPHASGILDQPAKGGKA